MKKTNVQRGETFSFVTSLRLASGELDRCMRLPVIFPLYLTHPPPPHRPAKLPFWSRLCNFLAESRGISWSTRRARNEKARNWWTVEGIATINRLSFASRDSHLFFFCFFCTTAGRISLEIGLTRRWMLDQLLSRDQAGRIETLKMLYYSISTLRTVFGEPSTNSRILISSVEHCDGSPQASSKSGDNRCSPIGGTRLMIR